MVIFVPNFDVKLLNSTETDVVMLYSFGRSDHRVKAAGPKHYASFTNIDGWCGEQVFKSGKRLRSYCFDSGNAETMEIYSTAHHVTLAL
jgi:hypothetical protein